MGLRVFVLNKHFRIEILKADRGLRVGTDESSASAVCGQHGARPDLRCGRETPAQAADGGAKRVLLWERVL